MGASSAHLLKRSGRAEAEDEQVSVGVGAGEALAVWGELAVENSSMTLTFDLGTGGPGAGQKAAEAADPEALSGVCRPC